MERTAHVDTYARDHLPPRAQWPELRFELPELRYPPRLNCARELLDHAAHGPWADRVAIRWIDDGHPQSWTYRHLNDRASRIARVLVDDLGLVPGNRVLLRGPNGPMLAACFFGVLKAGGIAVPTMKLLRAHELAQVIDRARVDFALCDTGLRAELDSAAAQAPGLRRTLLFGGSSPQGLEARMARTAPGFEGVDTAAEDVALIAFTSGTTGRPKAVIHFHRDVMVMCDAWPRSVLHPVADDVFCGTPPLAFTYGLGVMLCIPLRFGASVALAGAHTPASLLELIGELRCTIVATVPTFFRQMAQLAGQYDLRSLRMAVSSGEALPDATRAAFRDASGLELVDGLGSTELMQTVISHTPGQARRGATGRVIPGYRAAVLDDAGHPCPPGKVGRLAVKGASGCLYLDDPRQTEYVQNGWNLTGDAAMQDDDGYFYFKGRVDDLIVSAGYNISGLEIEATLLGHPAVAECGVVGLPDAERGQAVTAFVVLRPGHDGGSGLEQELQAYVKAAIAPYKYPRRIHFVSALPRGESGKLQRARLRSANAARA